MFGWPMEEEASPVSELLPERVSPELRHLQAKLAAQFPYRQAAALLEELLPETGGLNAFSFLFAMQLTV